MPRKIKAYKVWNINWRIAEKNCETC